MIDDRWTDWPEATLQGSSAQVRMCACGAGARTLRKKRQYTMLLFRSDFIFCLHLRLCRFSMILEVSGRYGTKTAKQPDRKKQTAISGRFCLRVFVYVCLCTYVFASVCPSCSGISPCPSGSVRVSWWFMNVQYSRQIVANNCRRYRIIAPRTGVVYASGRVCFIGPWRHKNAWHHRPFCL